MFRDLKLSSKLLGAITLVLAITSGISFWIMQSRINSQADEAFRDKLRQITGMTAATRTWFAGNIDSMVPDHNFKHLEQVPVVVAMRTAEQYASKEGMTFRTPSRHPRNPKNQANEYERRALEPSRKILRYRSLSSASRWTAARSCVTPNPSGSPRIACNVMEIQPERKILSAIPRKG